jgi:hypothetical protein
MRIDREPLRHARRQRLRAGVAQLRGDFPGRRTQAQAIDATGQRRSREQAGERDDRDHQHDLQQRKPAHGAQG